MNELKDVLDLTITKELYQVIISSPRQKGQKAGKVKIRPIMVKDNLMFQETMYTGTQVLHQNRNKEEAIEHMIALIMEEFSQCEISTREWQVTILVSKKGKITVKKSRVKDSNKENLKPDLSHNRVKKYILEEGKPVSFLVDLGVQTKEGQIIRAKYDKFKQINRYLEFIRDILPKLPKDRTIRIVDFGCGKSYLTFALYYYLHEMQKLSIDVIGLDLKEEVIRHCNELADKYGYDALHFIKGDIAGYNDMEKADMVVTLHACDTATDYALEKAVKWDAEVILSVPCCQHEVNRQMKCEELAPVLKYGVIKERMAALLTDALRANLLEAQGYEVQILEFIDMEHTPKNLLIRAIKGKSSNTLKKNEEIGQVAEFWGIETTLQKLLK